MTETTTIPRKRTRMSRISNTDIRRTRGGVPLSDPELELTDRAARQAGMTRGAYWRQAILEAAAADLGLDPEDLDEARRYAPRRRNQRPRPGGGQREEQGQ